MALDPDLSRRVLGAFVTSVTLVSSRAGAEDHVATVSSFSVASFSTPRVLISLSAQSRLTAMIRSAGIWGVSLLDGGGGELARYFARPGRANGAGIDQIAHSRGPMTGVVLFTQAVVVIECRTVGELDGGNHIVFLGEPVGMSTPASGPQPGGMEQPGGPDQRLAWGIGAPLCHFRGALYRPVIDPSREPGTDLPLCHLEPDHDEGRLL